MAVLLSHKSFNRKIVRIDDKQEQERNVRPKHSIIDLLEFVVLCINSVFSRRLRKL
jgi:hypothetical protein